MTNQWIVWQCQLTHWQLANYQNDDTLANEPISPMIGSFPLTNCLLSLQFNNIYCTQLFTIPYRHNLHSFMCSMFNYEQFRLDNKHSFILLLTRENWMKESISSNRVKQMKELYYVSVDKYWQLQFTHKTMWIHRNRNWMFGSVGI